MTPRTPNPYRPPDARAPSPPPSVRERRPFLWWGILTAPFLFFLLAVAIGRGLEELGHPLSEPTRETLIRAASGWASGSVRALFALPAAWLLERMVRRLRTDSERYRKLTIQITVVAIYLFGTIDALVHVGAVSPEHPVVRGTEVLPGLGIAAVPPLLLLWAATVFRQRRR